MAQLVALAPYIAGALTVYSSVREGEASNAAAQAEAIQLRQNANAERAAAQRAYLQEKKDARLVGSRARAVAAASGAGVSDPTISKILSDIEGEGEYRALMRLYQGDVTASGLEYGAKIRRNEGRAARSSGYLQAASTLFSTGSSLYSKYGGGGPKNNPGRGGSLVSYGAPAMQDFRLDESLVPSPRY